MKLAVDGGAERAHTFAMSEEKAKIKPELHSIWEQEKPLFPILQPAPLKGVARLAAEAEPAGEGHEVRFHALQARSILNRSISKRRLRFAWSVNPYRGCEFACRYCYARYTHEFLEMRDPAQFEREIYVKQQAAWLLRRDLHQVKAGEEIAIGTATDPYQPMERRMGVTRSLLEVLAEHRGYEIGIVTKSALITRDIDVLKEVARHNRLVLHVTITTPEVHLARILEPRAPRPDIRFETVRRLREAGLMAGILNSPLLPGLTDNAAALHRMALLAKQADASFFVAQPLFLKPCSKATFLAFIEEHFPALRPEYARRFDTAEFATKAYGERMQALVRAVTEKHGLKTRRSDALLTRTHWAANEEQKPELPVQGELFPVPAPQPSADGLQTLVRKKIAEGMHPQLSRGLARGLARGA
ncbi:MULTISPECIES: radical SAM protein [Acidobacterium]|nr:MULTISPECIES: radical SAM protein [Acidobacterium]